MIERDMCTTRANATPERDAPRRAHVGKRRRGAGENADPS
jgi:hypothetical protein